MGIANETSVLSSGMNSSMNSTRKEYLFTPAGLVAKTTICIIMTLIAIVGFIGNLSLIAFINKMERKIGHNVRAFTNLYLFVRSLAISDVISSALGPILWLQFFYDIFQTGWPCKIKRFSAIVFPVVTIYNLVIVALERYNCVCRPKRGPSFPRKRVQQLIRAAWTLGFLVTLLPMFCYGGVRMDLDENHYTIICGRDSSYSPYVVMFQVFLVLTYVLPLSFLIITSYRIVKVVRGRARFRTTAIHQNSVAEALSLHKQKQNKATRILVILIAAFVAPYLVFVAYNTFKTIAKPSMDFTTDFTIRYAATLLAYLNSPVNFCIHLVQFPAFRAEWRKRLACFRSSPRADVIFMKRKTNASPTPRVQAPKKQRDSCPNITKAAEKANSPRRRYSN